MSSLLRFDCFLPTETVFASGVVVLCAGAGVCLGRRDFLPNGLPRLELSMPTFTAVAESAAMLTCMSDVDAQMMQGIGRCGQYGRYTEGAGDC